MCPTIFEAVNYLFEILKEVKYFTTKTILDSNAVIDYDFKEGLILLIKETFETLEECKNNFRFIHAEYKNVKKIYNVVFNKKTVSTKKTVQNVVIKLEIVQTQEFEVVDEIDEIEEIKQEEETFQEEALKEETLQNEIEEIQQQRETLQSKIEEMNKQRETFQSKIEESQKRRETLQSKNEEIKQQIETLQNEIEEIKQLEELLKEDEVIKNKLEIEEQCNYYYYSDIEDYSAPNISSNSDSETEINVVETTKILSSDEMKKRFKLISDELHKEKFISTNIYEIRSKFNDKYDSIYSDNDEEFDFKEYQKIITLEINEYSAKCETLK